MIVIGVSTFLSRDKVIASLEILLSISLSSVRHLALLLRWWFLDGCTKRWPASVSEWNADLYTTYVCINVYLTLQQTPIYPIKKKKKKKKKERIRKKTVGT